MKAPDSGRAAAGSGKCTPTEEGGWKARPNRPGSMAAVELKQVERGVAKGLLRGILGKPKLQSRQESKRRLPEQPRGVT